MNRMKHKPEKEGKWKNLLYRFLGRYLVLCMFVFVVFLAALGDKDFLKPHRFLSVINANAALIVTALGAGLVMITGGFDFSAGAQISLLSSLIAIFGVRQIQGAAAVFLLLLTGTILGAVNGILTSYLRVGSVTATIATRVIYTGIAYSLTGETMSSLMPSVIYRAARITAGPFRLPFLIACVICVLTSAFLHLTFPGQYLRAIGLDEERSRQAGVRVSLLKCGAYSAAGFLYASAAILIAGRLGFTGTGNGNGMEITAIIAALIGGVSVKTEKVRVLNLTLGALTVGMITAAVPSVGKMSYIHYVFMGIVLLITILLGRRKESEV